MLTDLSHVIEVLQSALLRQLGDEVDLIFQYGSHLKDSTHIYSDIDLSYVPRHDSTHNHITVLVDDTMIDLYAIRWSTLEQMADFENVSATVLLNNRIVYQRNEEVGKRFQRLAERLHEWQQPTAYPTMLGKAQARFQKIGYQYYLLREQAQNDHFLAGLYHAHNILREVLHCLAICNQACVDTRKLEQVLALPKLPQHFAETIQQITHATQLSQLLSATETLLKSTRALLLEEQHKTLHSKSDFPSVFESAYPELKGDIQHLMLACEQRNRFNFNLTSLYHELMVHMAQAMSGVSYSDFNSLVDYEQNLLELGFPDLLSYIVAGDFDGLHAQCQVFDKRLRQFLTGHEVALNNFASIEELQAYLNLPEK